MNFKSQVNPFFLGLTTTLLSAQTAVAAEKVKPNIVFLFVDDLGYGDVGFNGSKYYETPNMDALAKQSLVFENSYAYPTSSPSRAALLTGKQSFRTGVYTVPVLEKGDDQENIFSRWTVEQKHEVYAQPLSEVGYKSIHIGKWHIVGPDPLNELKMEFPLKEKLKQPEPGDYDWVALHKSAEVQKYYPQGKGFNENVGGTFRGDPAFELGGLKSVTKGYKAPFSNPFITPKPSDEWLTDRLTDEAIGFMERNKKGPFFINLHFYAVHNPILARNKELYDKYLNKPGDSLSGQGFGPRHEHMAAYATMIESVDQNVQRILDYLDKNGLRENTIIILSSDNGTNGSVSKNSNLRGDKGYIYEGGVRVPTFFNWPNRITPRRSLTPISLLDYFPTFLSLAGVKNYKDVMDGNDLTPLFKKEDCKFKNRPIFWHIASQWKHGTCSAMRKGNYKLIQFLKDGAIELYDLTKDPKEEHNLSIEKPEVAKKMLNELVNWRKKNKAPLPPNSILKN